MQRNTRRLYVVELSIDSQLVCTLETRSITRICKFLDSVDMDLVDVVAFCEYPFRILDHRKMLKAWRGEK